MYAQILSPACEPSAGTYATDDLTIQADTEQVCITEPTNILAITLRTSGMDENIALPESVQ